MTTYAIRADDLLQEAPSVQLSAAEQALEESIYRDLRAVIDDAWHACEQFAAQAEAGVTGQQTKSGSDAHIDRLVAERMALPPEERRALSLGFSLSEMQAAEDLQRSYRHKSLDECLMMIREGRE
jgi:hypothetical protein